MLWQTRMIYLHFKWIWTYIAKVLWETLWGGSLVNALGVVELGKSHLDWETLLYWKKRRRWWEDFITNWLIRNNNLHYVVWIWSFKRIQSLPHSWILDWTLKGTNTEFFLPIDPLFQLIDLTRTPIHLMQIAGKLKDSITF
jgi:hypothetical protein